MAVKIIRAEPADQRLKDMGVASSTLGRLRYVLPASGDKTRDVYSADADFKGTLDDGQVEHITGRCCVTVHNRIAMGILPADGSATPIWFSTPVSELQATAAGTQGFLKKRPTAVHLKSAVFELSLSDVDKLLLNMQKYQSGQESALLNALAR